MKKLITGNMTFVLYMMMIVTAATPAFAADGIYRGAKDVDGRLVVKDRGQTILLEAWGRDSLRVRVTPDGNHNCLPDHEGKICFWTVAQTYHTTSATCASCDTNCNQEAGPCVKLEAVRCKSYLYVGCVCGDVDTSTWTFRGTYYACN